MGCTMERRGRAQGEYSGEVLQGNVLLGDLIRRGPHSRPQLSVDPTAGDRGGTGGTGDGAGPAQDQPPDG